MKTVGRRSPKGQGISEQRAFVETATALRGTEWFTPRGVFRFKTFEEADLWMDEMIRRTHGRLSRKTSSGSATP